MPAMHSDVLETMEEQLSAFHQRMLQLLPFDMTHEECIRLIAPAEHIPMLTQASKYADVKASQDWMSVQVPAVIDGDGSPTVKLRMRTHAQKEPPLSPRNPYWQLPIEPDTFEAGEKVIQWLTKRFELGRRFGTAMHVLRQLNEACENGQQLRFMLPPVLHLCRVGKSPRMDSWMTKHASYKPCRYVPALSPQLRQAVRDTAALLTSVCLIGEDVPELVPGEVEIAIWGQTCFTFAGVKITRM